MMSEEEFLRGFVSDLKADMEAMRANDQMLWDMLGELRAALTPDASAALAARDRATREAALREAKAACRKVREDAPNVEQDLAALKCSLAVEDLINKEPSE